MTTRLAVPVASRTYSKLQSKLNRKSTRRRAVRAGLLTVNVIALALIVVFVASGQQSTATKSAASVASAAELPAANPLDQLSSADIALTVARMSSLPESTAINSQAISQSIELTQAPTTDNVVAKPQVITTALKSRADIKSYVTQTGDTLSGLASKFGVTSDSIRWSNGLGSSEALTVNQTLTIPPVSGVVYTVVSGDTVDSLAAKYKTSAEKITAFNDAEIGGLKPGEQIIIPDGVITPAPVAAPRVAASSSSVSFPWGGGPLYGYNGYDYGYCTWYVATRISVPSNWGNAYTWDNLAPASGWTVSSTPRVGAVGQSDNISYLGHVAVVEAVSDDGSMIKYSDMNGIAGYGRVGYSDWVSTSHFQHYIYR
ncbi:MAG: LysM peptidoglycan-binding domain-containing protein [Candidatus Saccharimonadales bacterium]